MYAYPRLRALALHCRLPHGERKKKDGLHVSSHGLFHSTLPPILHQIFASYMMPAGSREVCLGSLEEVMSRHPLRVETWMQRRLLSLILTLVVKELIVGRCSEPMGSNVDIWSLQPGGPCLFRYLLLPLPGLVVKAEEVRYLVSCRFPHRLLCARGSVGTCFSRYMLLRSIRPVVRPMHEADLPPPSQLPSRAGTSVLKESKSAILQLPVVHKLSISHDMPNLSIPCPMTGQADLQGTSPNSRLLPMHIGLVFDQELHY